MAIAFPSWYKGGFPDAEKLFRDMINPFLDELAPSPDVVLWLPDDYHENLPIVTVFRTAGIFDPSTGRTDHPQILVGAIAGTRDDSAKLQEYIRQIVISFRKGGRVKNSDGSGYTPIDSAMEVTGPELTASDLIDPRLVYATYEIQTKKQVDAPADYVAKRNQLHA